MSGAFQTSREIFDSPIWKNIVDFRLFFLIYGNAVFSENGVKLADDLILERGQWCRSTRKLQEDLQYIENRQIKTYSTSVLNRCIKRLVGLQMICTRTHQLGTVFTVVNYNKYQGLHNYYNVNLERNLEHSGNSGGTVGEHSGNNNKNVKNVNKEKNVITTTTTDQSINPFKLFESEGFGTLSSIIMDRLGSMIDDYGDRWVIEAMKKSVVAGKRNLGYVEAILKRFKAEGVDEPWLLDKPVRKENSYQRSSYKPSKPQIPTVQSEKVENKIITQEELEELRALAQKFDNPKKEDAM